MEAIDLENLDILKDMRIKMFGKLFVLSPAADLAVHFSTIGDNLQEQASRYAFYAAVRDMCKTKMDACNLEVKQQEAKLESTWRGEGELPSGAKVTEASVIAALRADSDVQALREDALEAAHEFDLLNTVVRAFEHRRECLTAMAHRANNTTFNDSDVNITVTARVKDLEALKAKAAGRGAHPGNK